MENAKNQINEINSGLTKIQEGLDQIKSNESAFGDDQFFFDWYAALSERVKVFQTAVECELENQNEMIHG
ncbi:hypothetical protein KZP23_07535 [Echinicola marina]|uniref:hypothetical protein n=1 Tax=Echinicola marina TaxID=2859768 RepID=UPI001CF617AC|nr:hypothetical protein [Echinicola marina]UCS94852.1 hypothetical protein KZP23_07535 [Echinicola marina]